MNDVVSDELLERHPELRIQLIPTRDIHLANRSRKITSIGGYEWWRVEAFDHQTLSGVSVSFFRGDPFDVRYRHAVRAHRGGRLPDPAEARPAAFPAVHIMAVREGRLAALSCVTFPTDMFRELPPGADRWAVEIGENQIASYGDGWSVTATGPPSRLGWRGLIRPGAFDRSQVEVRLSVEPRFHTLTMQRASMPNSASGAEHDWLIACPSAIVSGRVTIHWPSHTEEIELNEATGAVDHLWGHAPLGEGYHRWYRSRLSWDAGAAVAEMTILRKFIQLAGTLTVFQPDAEPTLVRCERPPSATYQRGQWLLAYPLELTWRDLSGEHEFVQHVDRPTRVAPHRAFFLSRAHLECGEPPDEIVLSEQPAVFEVLQPRRIDWWPWRPWMRWRR